MAQKGKGLIIATIIIGVVIVSLIAYEAFRPKIQTQSDIPTNTKSSSSIAPDITTTQITTADLASLVLSGSPTNYNFDSKIYTYSGVTVLNSIDSITVTPTGDGVITVNGIEVISGKSSNSISLTAGEEKIITVVVKEVDKVAKTYVINIIRQESVKTVANQVKIETTAPTGGSITYSNGYYLTHAILLAVNDGTDSISGINTSARIVQRKSTTLSAGSCGSYGSFGVISPTGSYPNFIDSTLVSGNCYQFEYQVSDNASNQVTYISSNVIKVDLDAPTIPGTPSTSSISSNNKPYWTWTTSTDSVSGLATTPYTVEWSQDAGFSSGSFSSSNTNSFTHSSSLADGTWYFRVLASDAAGNSSAYSSTGTVLVDTTPPTFSNAEIGNVNSSTAAVTFSETVAATGDDYSSGVTIKVNNVTATISSATRQANQAVMYYVISSTVIYGDVITIAYSSTTGKITDTNGVVLATFSAQSITNSLSDPTLIADTFTDTNSTAIASHIIAPTNIPTASWRAEAGTWSIQSGKVQKTDTAGSHETASLDAGQANAVVEAYITLVSGGSNPGVVGRLTDNTHWIGARLTSTTFDLFQRNVGFTVLKQTAFATTTANTYRVRLSFSGTTVTATVNEGNTLTDTVTFNQTATRFGLWTDQTTSTFDNFRVGNGSLPQLGLLVFDGNSLTSGFGAATGSDYPDQLVAGLTQMWQMYNFGVGGQTTTQMSSDASTQIDTLYNIGRPKNIVIAWEVTNELYFGTSETDAYNNYVSYCQARRAAGFKVIAATILPRSNTGTSVGFETARQTANTAIRNNWATFADALADVAADNRIGDAGDELDTTYYYTDKVHMNATGYGVVAGIVKTAIESIH